MNFRCRNCGKKIDLFQRGTHLRRKCPRCFEVLHIGDNAELSAELDRIREGMFTEIVAALQTVSTKGRPTIRQMMATLYGQKWRPRFFEALERFEAVLAEKKQKRKKKRKRHADAEA